MTAGLDFETPTRDERRAAYARELADQEARAERYRGPYLDHEACARRYPRLFACAKWAACLCSTEAGSALRELRSGWEHGGCEAVAHFGGPRAVVSAAWRARRGYRLARREGWAR